MPETFLIGADAGIADNLNIGNNYISMCKWAASVTGTITEVRIKVGASVNVKVGIWADSASEPGTLLASNETSVACTTGWNTLALSLAITSGTNYWIGINSDSSNVRYYGSGAQAARYKVWTYATAFPDPAGTGWGTATFESAFAGWNVAVVAGIASRRLLIGVGI